MRITNSMIMNNSLSNVSANKKNADRLNTQMSTEKKIQKPSEDPVVAIRALRLRSNLAELNQYLKKNVPDASSWLKITEDALSGVSSMLTGMNQYLVQGATDGLTAEDRNTIIENLSQFREQIFHDANADYAGRTVFTGYKTDKNMTFKTNEDDVTYKITENITKDSFDYVTKVENLVDDNKVAEVDIADMPKSYDVYRVRLAYEGLDAGTTVAINDKDGSPLVAPTNIITVSQNTDGKYEDQDGNILTTGIYQPGADEVYYLADTGELIFGSEAYKTVNSYTKETGEIQFTYDKTGFEKGDLLPEHYFDTVRTEGQPPNSVESKFTSKTQDIEYTVNFNQKLKVNTEGKNVFNHKMVRDLDELIEKVKATLAVEKKIKNIEGMMKETVNAGKQTELQSMLEAAKKEFDLADDIMQKTFELAITDYQGHQERIDLEIADIGSRDKRLELNKERLTSQEANFEELKSLNEDVDMAETIIKYKAAEVVYDASLLAASKVVTKSLLDFI